MITLIPPMGILIDIPLGVLMWSMLAQFVLDIFLRDDSRLALMRLIRGLNTPMLFVLGLTQPSFINDRLAHVSSASLGEKGQMLLLIEQENRQQIWHFDRSGRLQRQVELRTSTP